MATTTVDTALLEGKVLSFWEQHTPQSSPEPEALKLPDEANTQDEKSSLLTNLISRVNNVDEDPWLTLGVRNSEEFNARANKIVNILDKAKGDKVEGAAGAFEKAQKANTQLDGFFKNSKLWLQRTLDHKTKSYAEVLSLDTQDEDPQNKYKVIKSYLNPEFIKEPGVEDAVKVLDNALKEAIDAQSSEKDSKMKDVEDDDQLVDKETLALYEKASPWVFQLFKAVHLLPDKAEGKGKEGRVPASIEHGFHGINDEIFRHNRTKVEEAEADGLQISIHRLRGFAEDASPYLTKLEANPSDEDATKGLDQVNKDLLDFNRHNHYPSSWQIHVRGSLDEMLERAPVSTEMDIPCPAGSTFDGGRIIRYSAAGATEGEKRYSFIVEIEGRYYFKSGRDVGESATQAYINTSSKVKMGTYYGETRYKVEYSKKYFNELRQIQKSDGKSCLSFLGAARRSHMTKSGKNLPAESCVILIRDPKLNRAWYDVFSRSAWTKFYGSDAGHRFDKYWKDLGEKPSEKKGDGETKNQGGHSSPDDPAMKTVREDINQLRKDVGDLQSLNQAVIGLKDSMNQMMEKIAQLTASIPNTTA